MFYDQSMPEIYFTLFRGWCWWWKPPISRPFEYILNIITSCDKGGMERHDFCAKSATQWGNFKLSQTFTHYTYSCFELQSFQDSILIYIDLQGLAEVLFLLQLQIIIILLRHVQNLNQSHGVTVYAWTAVTPKAKSRWTLFPVLYSKKILQKLILESLWNTSHVNSRVLVESYLWNMPRILIVVKCLVTMKHDAFSTTEKRDMKNTEMFTRVLFRRFIARVGKSTYP